MNDVEILKKLEDSTKDATRVQLQTLQSILERNGAVNYLQPYLGGGCHAPAVVDAAATFRSAVPLSSYDDYADHINRMADDGASDDHGRPLPSLSVDPLVCFFYSSGTTTLKPKLIPYFDSAPSKSASSLAHLGSNAVLQRLFPPNPTGSKILWFLYAGNVTTTSGGYKAMAASSLPWHRKNPNLSAFNHCVSPSAVILGLNLHHQMYCHLLCGLRNCNSIDGIRAPYAIGLIKAFSLLESKWEQLCKDLECGIPSLDISDVAMRDSVVEVLGGPQLELSKKIHSICNGKDWAGILGKLWPNARYIKCVTTGSMKQYYPKLKYYAGEIPVLCGDYFASECPVAVNFNIIQPPELTRFVMLPFAAYFEFLPFDLDRNNYSSEVTVDFSSVEVGKTYEVVVTTYRGFYRYCLGDIVRVVGFHNSSPEVEFVMRAPKNCAEVITERQLISAIEDFQILVKKVSNAEVIEYASFFDPDLSPKQLKVFLEIKEVKRQESAVVLLKRCCSALEDGLQGMHKVMRERGELRPLLLYIVEPGSFDKLLLMAIDKGAPASQYKAPKIIRNREMVEFLENCAVVTVASDSCNA